MFRNIGQKILASSVAGKPSVHNQIWSDINVQSIRWRARRPWALGTSKSKLFRIKKVPYQNPEDTPDYQRLLNDYQARMRALTQHFLEEKRNRVELSTQIQPHDANLDRIEKINDDWNRNLAELREVRLAKQRAEEEIQILEDIERRQEEQETERRRINELVLKEKEAAKSFIVRENIEEAIERALSAKTDYNFAIDLSGKLYKGRNPRQSAADDEKQLLEQMH